MAYFLAVVSAAAYGAADFLGGLASRAASTVTVVFVAQAAGLIVLGLLLPVLPAAAPSARDLAWGLAAGAAGSLGVALLYRALAIGTMALVAPTTAVCAVIVPVAAGVLLGERPTTRVAIGIVVALLAIVLVSQAHTTPAPQFPTPTTGRVAAKRGPSSSDLETAKQALWRVGSWTLGGGGWPRRFRLPRGLALALASGVAIGLFFLCLAQTAMDAGLWPLAAARALALVLFGPIALRPAVRRLEKRVLGIAVGGGILDMLANACYLIAVREGPLTAVVTLSSLYPASTILLARVVLHERLLPVQVAGIAAALLAVLLIVG